MMKGQIEEKYGSPETAREAYTQGVSQTQRQATLDRLSA